MFQKPPHRPDFCPERKFGCWLQGNPAKLGAAGINPVKNPDISTSEGRLITGRVIFTLNPAPGLFLEAFSFSSSRFVQGTTPPKQKDKNPSRFPGIQERLSRVARIRQREFPGRIIPWIIGAPKQLNH